MDQMATRVADQEMGVALDVLQSCPIGLGVVSNRVLSWANDSFIKMIGYPENEINNRDTIMLYPSAEEYEMVGKILHDTIRERGIGIVNTRLVRKDRQPLDCCLIAFPADRTAPFLGQIIAAVELGGKSSGVQVEPNGLFKTRLKRIETQRAQSQKLEAIGRLAGGIAHDFNNILSAVIGYGELAQLSVPVDQPELNHCLENIVNAGQRAKALVRQILSFSRQPNGKQIPVDMGAVVQEAVNLLRATLPTTIEIRQRINPSTDPVLADPTQIHQIILNLCTNAQHAMGEQGGKLELIVDGQTVDAEMAAADAGLKPGSYVRLTVADNGCGMPPDVMDHIFDPYYTTKGTDKGTGLGLSLVASIVHRQKGVIRVRSQVGEGSAFTIWLPASHGRFEADQPPLVKDLPGGNERILFVDDEDALSDLGKRMLEHLGYRATVMNSSLQALDAFHAAPESFDLIVTDMSMPKMSGKQFAREALKIRPDIPIIICTGHSESISEETAKALGIRGFLMKPMDFQQVSRTIRRVLDG